MRACVSIATMWKVSCVVLLAVASRLCVAETGSPRNVRRYDDLKDRPKVDAEPYSVEYVEDDEYRGDDSIDPGTGGLIGRWRNNGEALEPKWRDGDSVPLVPFYTATIRDESHRALPANGALAVSVENEYSTVHRPRIEDAAFDGQARLNLDKLTSNTERRRTEDVRDDGYGKGHRYFGNNERKLARREKHPHAQGEVDKELQPNSRRHEAYGVDDDSRSISVTGRRNQVGDGARTLRTNINLDGAVSRYQETFQNHPNQYELNDDEYERPRPRKRRPPQIHDFAELKIPRPEFRGDKIAPLSEATYDDKSFPIGEKGSSGKVPRKPNYSSKGADHRRAPIDKGSDMQARLSENAELKSLLKMQQGQDLSLSEILQQKNLTLADLLDGKASIVDILKTTESEADGVKEPTATSRRKNSDLTSTISERARWVSSQRVTAKDNSATNRPPGKYPSQSSSSEDPLAAIAIKTTMRSFVEDSVGFVRNYDRSTLKSDVVHYDSGPENSNEDEIMEFSDFTVKKSTSSTPKTNNFDWTTNVEINSATSLTDVFRDMDLSFDVTRNPNSNKQAVPPKVLWNENLMSAVTTERSERVSSSATNLKKTTVNNRNEDGQRANVIKQFKTSESGYRNDYQRQKEEVDKNEKDVMQNDHAIYDKVDEEEITNPSTDKIGTSPNKNVDDASNAKETFPNDDRSFTANHKLDGDVIEDPKDMARAEIFELFTSGCGGKRLERLLKARNMSIDELIALRQRGSSQVHLAEVFQTREQNLKSNGATAGDSGSKSTAERVRGNTKERNEESTTHRQPEQFERREDEPEEGDGGYGSVKTNLDEENERLTLDLTELFTRHGQPNNIKTVGNSEPDDFQSKNSDAIDDVKNSTEILDLMNTFDSLPFSKNIQQDSEGSPYYASITEVKLPVQSDIKRQRANGTNLPADELAELLEAGRVEEIGKEEATLITNVYEAADTFDDNEDIVKKRQSDLKPSIIASGSILGVTIIVFLAILISCRIRQRKRFTYKNAFSKAVFQNSVLAARKLSNSSSLNTIMVDIVATSTTQRPEKRESRDTDNNFESNGEIDHDSLDANDSWETIPDFMK